MMPSSEAELANLVDRLLERLRAGERPALSEVLDANPEHAEALQELWGTILLTEEVASHSDWGGEPTLIASPENGAALTAFPREVGDYRILREIGRGGMGVVYEAEQRSLRRIVALKMILHGHLASEVETARFRAEAAAAAHLQHPNIVPIYEVGALGDHPYFSMQLVDGTTLAKRLADGPLPGRKAAQILAAVGRAIAEAHRHGILHRDLKPSNILLDEAGTPFVTDFGLAKRFLERDAAENATQFTSLTQSGAILGTPAWMAPEQAAGRRGEVSPQTDVYSLGAILYALLTGRPPFQAATAVDTLLMVLEQDPVAPRFLNPRADRDLEMIVLKCLQKPADLRYATADDFVADLQAYLNHEPISARSSHFSQMVTRAFRETHHAALLENWGLVWMWHSLVVLLLCVVTEVLHHRGVTSRWVYCVLWTAGLGVWAAMGWKLRQRAGPITFVERQVAHVWGTATLSSILLFFIEWMLQLKTLTLSPVLAIFAGGMFAIKAGILSGAFYLQAAILFATAFLMAALKSSPNYDYGLGMYGVILAASFFIPGLKYDRQRREMQKQSS